MKVLWCSAVVVLACVLCARADLDGEIKAVLADKLLAKASVGIQIVQLGPTSAADKVIYSWRSDLPLMPASNMKLVTAATALDVLGGDFRFHTVLVQRGDDLILIGDGDPAFGDEELLKKVGWDSTTVFANWAKQLKKAGLTSFRNVLVDDSVFDQQFVHPHWPSDQEQSRYVAQVGGMEINVNCLDVYVRGRAAGSVVSYTTKPPTRYAPVQNSCISGGENAVWLNRKLGTNDITLHGTCPTNATVSASVTIHDPAMFAATVLAETLSASGIKITGKVAREIGMRSRVMQKDPAHDWSILATHETPISTVLARANKDSMNLYAESLCKRNGAAVSGTSGSWQNGTAAASAFLKRAGAEAGQFKLDDGCGLSRDNAVSASTLMAVLRHAFHGKEKQDFVSSLAVGGEDGTLEKRFHDLRDRIHAKTGYIVGVSALSGYLQTRDGRWHAFSILMNGLPKGTNATAKTLQERIVRAIEKK